MSKFSLPSETPSANSTPAYSYSPNYSDDDDEDTLPYPRELPRNDFLAADFDPQTYLSSLRNRHQTLEDLRSDLRKRSQLLNQELLDLVNGNYEEFLSLGHDLKGGEERVEGVRVGLLGFRREVEGIQRAVKGRSSEMGGLLKEKKKIRSDVVLGRSLLEVDRQLAEMEEGLAIVDVEGEEGEDEALDFEDDEEELEASTEASGMQTRQLRRLERHTERYVLLTRRVERIGSSHPFLVGQKSRLDELKRTLLLDLAAALRQAKSAKAPEALLKILRLYGDLGAEKESVRVLKGG